MKVKTIFGFVSLFSISLVLSACGAPEPVDLSYNQAIEIYKDNMSRFSLEQDFAKEGEFLEWVDLDVELNSEVAVGSLSVRYDNHENLENSQSQKTIDVQWNLEDYIVNSSYDLDFFGRLIAIADNQYFNISRASIDMWDGSFEGMFLNSIFEGLVWNWIKLDDIWGQVYNDYNDLWFQEASDILLLSGDLFDYESTEYNGMSAYKLTANEDVLSSLIESVGDYGDLLYGVDTMDFYLVMESEKNIYLLIKKNETNDDFDDTNFEIKIWNNTVDVKLFDKTEETWNFVIKAMGWYFDIEMTENTSNLNVLWTVSIENREWARVADFRATVMFDSGNLLNTNFDTNMKMNISGIYSLEAWTGLNIEEPESYINFEDLMSDSFGMPYLMDQEMVAEIGSGSLEE